MLLGSGKRGPRVVRVLGKAGVARVVLEALMLEHGLRRTFPKAVEEEARAVAGAPARGPTRPGGATCATLPTFTVDPDCGA